MKIRTKRSTKGTLVIELAAGTFLLMIFTLIAVHLTVMVYGAFINDRACRDAARAAAQGQSPSEAFKLASCILTTHNPVGTFVEAPQLKGPIQYEDYGGTPPAGRSPFVHVSTQTKVHAPFALLSVCGETFNDGTVAFTQSYTFPIVRVK